MRSLKTGIGPSPRSRRTVWAALGCVWLSSFQACGRPAPPADSLEYWNLDIYRPFFRERRQADGSVSMVPQRPRAGARSFPKVKPPGAFRVFIIGGSVARQYDSQPGFSRGLTLEAALSRSAPERHFEVINCGMGGYDSYRESLSLREVAGFSPDLVVFLSGNNALGSSTGPPTPRQRLALRVRRTLRRCGIPIALRVRPRPSGRLPETDIGGRLAGFRADLRGMVRLARASGAAVVLCTMPRALGLSRAEPLPLDDEAFLAGWVRWEQGDAAGAERSWLSYHVRHPQEGVGPLWIGRCREKLGDPGSARRWYAKALEQSGIPRINDVIRGIGREESVALADLEQAFARQAAQPGAVGLFQDEMHWHRFADPLVSLTVARAWGRGRPAQEVPVLKPTPREYEQAWRAGLDRGMWSSVPPDDMGPGFIEQSVDYFTSLIRGYPQRMAGLKDRADDFFADVAGNESLGLDAASAPRRWAAGLGHAGEAYRRLGRPRQAMELFREALRLDPGQDAVRVRMVSALRARGESAASETLLAALKPLSPRFPEIEWLEGSYLPEAAQALDRALDLLQQGSWAAGSAALAEAEREFRSGRTQDALRACQGRSGGCAAAERWRGRIRRLGEAGRIALEAGQTALARSILERMALWAPDDQEARERRGAILAALGSGRTWGLYTAQDARLSEAAWQALGRSFASFGQKDWTAGFREAGRATGGFSPQGLRDLSSFCTRRALTCAPWQRALGEIKRLNDLGITAFQAGDLTTAQRRFNEAVELAPFSQSALINLAAVASRRGRWREAKDFYDRALAGEPPDPGLQADLLNARALSLGKLGRTSEAISDLRQALECSPPSWPRRGQVQAELRRLEPAAQ